jgi:hypothetical protein
MEKPEPWPDQWQNWKAQRGSQWQKGPLQEGAGGDKRVRICNFICSLFKDALSVSKTIASNDRMKSE